MPPFLAIRNCHFSKSPRFRGFWHGIEPFVGAIAKIDSSVDIRMIVKSITWTMFTMRTDAASPTCYSPMVRRA